MAEGLELFVLGIGDAFSALHHPTSLLLRAAGRYLALECPDGYRRVLREASLRCGEPLPLAEVDWFVVSHLHGDHSNGIELTSCYKRSMEQKRMVLLMAEEVHAGLWEGRLRGSLGQMWNGQAFVPHQEADFLEYRPLAPDRTTELGPFRIRIRPTHHHIPTTAVLVEACGRKVGFSADTIFDPELIDWLAEADLILHEANHGPAHTPYARLRELPTEVRRKLRLIHCPDGFDPGPDGIPLVREGERIVV